jgi:type IV secretory pathway VirJ component
MLKHKARIQCARQAFGFAGIYDEDEAVRIIEAEVVASESTKKAPSIMPKRIAQEQPPVPAPAQQPEPLPQPEMTAEEKEYIAVLESGEKDA